MKIKKPQIHFAAKNIFDKMYLTHFYFHVTICIPCLRIHKLKFPFLLLKFVVLINEDNFFFYCYSAVPRTNLGHYRGDILTHPMLIIQYLMSNSGHQALKGQLLRFYNFDPKVTGSFVTRLSPSAGRAKQKKTVKPNSNMGQGIQEWTK